MEDEANGAGGQAPAIPLRLEDSGRSYQSRDVSIVPASVHDTCVLGDEVVGIRLLYGKGVHVGAKCDEGTLAVIELRDHPRSADPRTNGKAEGLHLPCRDPCRSDLLERKLRILMKVSTDRSEVRGERLGLFEKIHGASGV